MEIKLKFIGLMALLFKHAYKASIPKCLDIPNLEFMSETNIGSSCPAFLNFMFYTQKDGRLPIAIVSRWICLILFE